jgi:hypothetical protein
METVDKAHISTSLNCVGATTLETELNTQELTHLAATLDLLLNSVE